MGPNWIKKHKEEKYYKLAQKEGLRSRAAFKLRQINSKFHIIKEKDLILDLCCAPGGWIEEIKLQYGDVMIVGVDLVKMAPVEEVSFIQEDIREDRILDKLESMLPRKVNVVLSDCAPKMTGTKELDKARQLHLIERIFLITSRFLRRGGHLVCKLFDGGDLPTLRNQLKLNFDKIFFFKPRASRKQSAELYLIGKYFTTRMIKLKFN
ncbi:MAG: SAM-dependent methyltransferase [Candidatus Helarchaeota archaeon]